MSAGDVYNSNNINSTLSPRFLSLLRHCQESGQRANSNDAVNNWTVTSAGPTGLTAGAGGLSSTEITGEGEEDTDFGAVMYITAVLVFYSLGIVVMIIKYLQTERREMEEEMALESYLQGIPSKLIEQERQAVNRVAIQAFHTLTSGSKRHNHVLVPGPEVKVVEQARSASELDHHQVANTTTLAASSTPDNSESSEGEGLGEDSPPRLLRRERSKHLPRVSLVFRDRRSSDRRKMHQDSIRSKSGRAPVDDSLLPGQRSPHSRSASPQPAENGQAGVYLDIPAEPSITNTSSADTSANAPPSANPRQKDNRGNSRKTSRRGASAGVRFEDERTPCVKKFASKTGGKGRGSKQSYGGGGNMKTPKKGRPESSQTNECSHRLKDSVHTPTDDIPTRAVAQGSAGSANKPRSNRHKDSANRSADRKRKVNDPVPPILPDTVNEAKIRSDNPGSSVVHSVEESPGNATLTECDDRAVNSGQDLTLRGSPTKVIAANVDGSDHVTVIADGVGEKVGTTLPKRLLVSDV